MSLQPDVLPASFVLKADRIAKGGACIGKAPDGRTAFITGTIPGEQVEVTVEKEHKNRVETTCDVVVDPSPHRIKPACKHVQDGCGGCDWQHIDATHQSTLRNAIVADGLRRLGGITDVPIVSGPTLSAADYRSTVKAAVINGKAGFRKVGSHDLVAVDQCVIAHPLAEEVLSEGNFGEANEITIRVGVNTGDRLLIVDVPKETVSVPEDVVVVEKNELKAGKRAFYHEEVGGKRFRISAYSFFQCRPDGALTLAQLVNEAISQTPGTVLDAYCGVGLFGVLSGEGRTVVGVESNKSAIADAKINYAKGNKVIHSRFENWTSSPFDVVIADPARAGLKKQGCAKIAATGAQAIALISCDPASLARDAKILTSEHNYSLEKVTTVDMFAHTSHVETVSLFT